LESLGVPDAFAEWIGVGLVVALITYASLIIGELVPKQIALRNPERVAARVAPFMTVVSRIGSPLVTLLDFSGRLVLRMIGQGSRDDQKVSEDEIRTLMAEAETAGVIEAAEREMMATVMRLGDRPVRALMTPRRDVDMIDLTAAAETIRRTLEESIHSRLPVHEGQADEVLGIVQSKDLLNAYLRGGVPDVRDHVLAAPTIPDTADVLDAVDSIKGSSVHLALIMDEYGHFQGVVTNADILEEIVGAFATEEGQAEAGAVQRSDGSWLISGSMPVDEMAERIGVTVPIDRNYYTAAGFVLDRFGYLPSVGECVTDHGWRFEIVDLDRRRIDKILAQRLSTRRPK
jgi:putative hemolysin